MQTLAPLFAYLQDQQVLPPEQPAATPPVAGWRNARLPATMSAADVTALLDACDRSQGTASRSVANRCGTEHAHRLDQALLLEGAHLRDRAISAGVRVSSTSSIAIETLSASSTSSATSGAVSNGSGSQGPT